MLEEDSEGFSATNLAGAAALRLLQLGQVAVLLNTARSLIDVQQRAEDFTLLGGVGCFGASVWEGPLSVSIGRENLRSQRNASVRFGTQTSCDGRPAS